MKLRHLLARHFQRVLWLYLTDNFVISHCADLNPRDVVPPYDLVPVTLDNFHRVLEFREESRVSEYREKVLRNEIGLFAEYRRAVIGSIWATLNRSDRPVVVRRYMPLLPNEALIHDIVTGDQFRGMGVGSHMVYGMAARLLEQFAVSRIVVDVSVKNVPSLRMMAKVGAPLKERALYVSTCGTLLYSKIIRRYCA